LSISTSPTSTFHSPPSSFGGPQLTRKYTGAYPKQLKPFATEDIKILLLENVNQTGQDILEGQGYQVEFLKSSLPEDKLIEKIRYDLISLGLLAGNTDFRTETST
jgi:D-3-phosphoglycerate dehydrogenase / 2-oxoglutarate reductase